MFDTQYDAKNFGFSGVSLNAGHNISTHFEIQLKLTTQGHTSQHCFKSTGVALRYGIPKLWFPIMQIVNRM